jgi:hypothetical protein
MLVRFSEDSSRFPVELFPPPWLTGFRSRRRRVIKGGVPRRGRTSRPGMSPEDARHFVAFELPRGVLSSIFAHFGSGDMLKNASPPPVSGF